jgi:hypothetical protein
MTKRGDLMERARRRSVERAEANAQSRAKAEVHAITLTAASKEKVPEVDRDGLEWLIKRRQMSPNRVATARYYRELYRDGDASPLGSSLGNLDRVDGPGRPGLYFEVGVSNRYELQRVRSLALGGQVDMLTVMDGVVGTGHSLRYLAGGDGHRADALMRVLFVALDLVEKYRLTNVHETAHPAERSEVAPAIGA